MGQANFFLPARVRARGPAARRFSSPGPAAPARCKKRTVRRTRREKPAAGSGFATGRPPSCKRRQTVAMQNACAISLFFHYNIACVWMQGGYTKEMPRRVSSFCMMCHSGLQNVARLRYTVSQERTNPRRRTAGGRTGRSHTWIHQPNRRCTGARPANRFPS